MILGFTGSRNKPNNNVYENLQKFIIENKNKIIEAHHGDCIGSDKIFDNEIKKYGIKTIIHPPNINNYRSFCSYDEIKSPMSFLKRNKNIVDSSNILIALPPTDHEIIRSGSWQTIRYARKKNKKIYIFYPNGNIVIEKN